MPLVPARLDAVTLAVADVERSKVFDRDVMGFTLVTDVRDEIDRAPERLVAAGVRVVAPAEDKPLGPRIPYVADPDGHMWETGHLG